MSGERNLCGRGLKVAPPSNGESYPRRACPKCGEKIRVNEYGTLAPHAGKREPEGIRLNPRS